VGSSYGGREIDGEVSATWCTVAVGEQIAISGDGLRTKMRRGGREN
jgi:hypothetical protein